MASNDNLAELESQLERELNLLKSKNRRRAREKGRRELRPVPTLGIGLQSEPPGAILYDTTMMAVDSRLKRLFHARKRVKRTDCGHESQGDREPR